MLNKNNGHVHLQAMGLLIRTTDKFYITMPLRKSWESTFVMKPLMLLRNEFQKIDSAIMNDILPSQDGL